MQHLGDQFRRNLGPPGTCLSAVAGCGNRRDQCPAQEQRRGSIPTAESLRTARRLNDSVVARKPASTSRAPDIEGRTPRSKHRARQRGCEQKLKFYQLWRVAVFDGLAAILPHGENAPEREFISLPRSFERVSGWLWYTNAFGANSVFRPQADIREGKAASERERCVVTGHLHEAVATERSGTGIDKMDEGSPQETVLSSYSICTNRAIRFF